MKKTAIIIIGVIAILVSGIYSAFHYFEGERGLMIPGNYLKAEAVITAVYPPRVTRYGVKQARYDLYFTDREGNKTSKMRQELKGGLQVNDTVYIRYNPDDLSADVVLDKDTH